MDVDWRSKGDTQYLYIESKNINYVCENVTIKEGMEDCLDVM